MGAFDAREFKMNCFLEFPFKGLFIFFFFQQKRNRKAEMEDACRVFEEAVRVIFVATVSFD